MPKLGRRNDYSGVDYFSGPKEMTTRNAPFGTNDTPVVRTRIIGGKAVFVDDEDYSPRTKPTAPTLQKVEVSQKSQSVLPPIPISSPTGYSSANIDYHNSQVHNKDAATNSSGNLNPHKVVPPISAPPHVRGEDYPTIEEILVKFSPRGHYIPHKSITLSKKEDLVLRRKLNDELGAFDVRKLKEVYTTLTGFDHNLSGYVTFQDLSFTMVKAKVHVSVDTLRLVASLYVSDSEPGKVNYEKILSFLAASQKEGAATFKQQSANQFYSIDDSLGMSPNPEKLQDDWEVTSIFTDEGSASLSSPPASPREYRKQNKEGQDIAKLLRLLQIQLADAGQDLDIDRIYTVFQEADRDHRGSLSKDQIKTITYKCRIPLQESVINQIVEKFKTSNGQYKWQEYVMFLERVLPSKTGLPLPQSKKPMEYVKHFPQPTEHWPKAVDTSPRQAFSHSQPVTSPTGAQQHKSVLPQGTDNMGDLHTPKSHRDSASQPPKDVVDPNDFLNLFSPRGEKLAQIEEKLKRQRMIDHLDIQLKKLENEYEMTKKEFAAKNSGRESESKSSKTSKDDDLPWFERFMKMANALYANDTNNSGYLPLKDVSWVTDQYNQTYNMGISMSVIDAALNKSTHNGSVALDPYLKMLASQEP